MASRQALTTTTTSDYFLLSGAFLVFYALVQNRGEWISFGPYHELHGGRLCGPSLAVEQPLAFDLMLAKLIDAAVDEGGRSRFVADCHLETRQRLFLL